jgi:hypothetical protein
VTNDRRTFDTDAINELLRVEQPARLILQSFEPRARTLTVALTFDGGPREDDALVIVFDGSATFHVSAVSHQPGFFVLLPADAARRYVPSVSFDHDEFGPAGCRVVAFTDPSGMETGYYVACERCTMSWQPRNSLAHAW